MTVYAKKEFQLPALALICFCSFFVHLGAHDVDLMEARNFVTAREMVRYHNWLIPTLNGELRVAKPPLPTWITAAVGLAGGDVDNKTLMRLPAALVASLMVFSLWGLMRTFSDDGLLPFFGAAVLATSMLIIDNGRRGNWDVYTHSFMLAAIWALAYGWQRDTGTGAPFLLAGLCLAFSFMSKGPVAFYGSLLPFAGAYGFAYGWRPVREKWIWLCLSLAVLVVVSSLWPLYIYAAHPEIVKAMAAREVSSWASSHVRPFYFYGSFPFYTGIWVLFTVAGFVKPYAGKHVDAYGRYRFVLCWIIVSLVLLSIIPEKKERYLIPVIIPTAMMVGHIFRSLVRVFGRQTPGRGDRWLLWAQTILACGVALAAPVFLGVFGWRRALITVTGLILWSAAFWGIAGLTVLFGGRRKAGGLFVLNVVLVCLINLSLPPILYRSPVFRNNPQYRSLRGVQEMKRLEGVDFYHAGRIDPIEVWEIGKRVTPINFEKGDPAIPRLPLVLFSDAKPSAIIPGSWKRQLDIEILGSFRYDPRKYKKIKYVALLQKKAPKPLQGNAGPGMSSFLLDGVDHMAAADAVDQRHDDGLSPPRGDDVMTHNGFRRVVPALDKDVRL